MLATNHRYIKLLNPQIRSDALFVSEMTSKLRTENRSNHLADFTNQDNTDETKLSSLPSMLISPGAISVSTTKWRKRKKIKESMRPFHSTEQIPEKNSVCSLDF